MSRSQPGTGGKVPSIRLPSRSGLQAPRQAGVFRAAQTGDTLPGETRTRVISVYEDVPQGTEDLPSPPAPSAADLRPEPDPELLLVRIRTVASPAPGWTRNPASDRTLSPESGLAKGATMTGTTMNEEIARTDLDARADLPAHERTYAAFNRVMLFAVLHIILTLGCLALAFLGHAPVLALLLGVGGTVALIAGFALSG